MKNYCTIISLFILNFYFSQQTESLKIIKEKYDNAIKNTEEEYNKNISHNISRQEKSILFSKKTKELRDLDFNRNRDYLNEISKIKPSIIPLDSSKIIKNEIGEIIAVHPKGSEFFKKEFMDNFLGDEINAKGIIACKISFIIETDGSIQDVKAISDNEDFSKYAILAIYLTQEKWIPARLNGYPVRYRFSLPLTLNFE